jgi:adenosylmethionine-8-amino-7-oxononanoate aminotransferase
MTRILHRQIREKLPVAVGGSGVVLRDADGREYIDASGGAAVSCLGHNHPDVQRSLHEQVDKLAYAHTNFFTTEVAEELADTLISDAPEGLSHVFFVSGGSEAVESALKMARQYFVERGEPQRRYFIARRQSFHGNTLGALSAGGHAQRRKMFGPLMIDVRHIEPCFSYRYRRADESEEAYGRRAADALDSTINELGPENVIGFVAETVVGATAGVVPAVPGYFKRVREICDQYGVLLILDEVMCGMGRTGTMHACEQEGIAPDIIAIAKGLGGGYQPIGATLLSRKIFDAFANGSGFFQHSHTYIGHPLACAAALAVQKVIKRDRLLDNVKKMGWLLGRRLSERFGNHPFVGDIRGRGLFQGIELVSDRTDKTPFDPGLKVHAKIKQEAMARGLAVYPAGGTADGIAGDHVLIAPPFIIEASQVDAIVERLGDAVDAATAKSL